MALTSRQREHLESIFRPLSNYSLELISQNSTLAADEAAEVLRKRREQAEREAAGSSRSYRIKRS